MESLTGWSQLFLIIPVPESHLRSQSCSFPHSLSGSAPATPTTSLWGGLTFQPILRKWASLPTSAEHTCRAFSYKCSAANVGGRQQKPDFQERASFTKYSFAKPDPRLVTGWLGRYSLPGHEQDGECHGLMQPS